MESLGLLVLRGTVGGLLAGHGAQKLFGSFGGYGPEGTAGWLESMGLRPGREWAALAGWSEFGGGVLTALGFLGPIGPLGIIGAMSMATAKVHSGKPVWVTAGGPELPLTNMAAALCLILAGPGKLSLDALFGVKISRWLALPGLAVIAATVSYAMQPSESHAEAPKEVAGAELQAGDEAAHPV